jgi:sRNA-binding protein
LGPPNYHAYQAKLKELHEERFARMPFEKFKANVKVVHDEAIVAQWLEEQSWTTEYTDPKNPDAPKLHSLEEVQQHFKAHHMKGVVDRVKSAEVSGDFQKQVARPFRDLVKFYVDDQRRFPLQLATELSHQFTRQGLQFFKVNKTVTHVSVSRPHYLDLEATPVSDMVQRIVQFIDQTPDCSRAKVMQALAPSPAAEENAPAAEENAPAAEENAPAAEENTPVTKENAPAAELTPEQAAVSTDLHWLIHQGHVIEFSNGKMETAKKPKQPPVPTQPQKKAKKKWG